MTAKDKKLLAVFLFTLVAGATAAVQIAHHNWGGLFMTAAAAVWCILYAQHVDDWEVK
jgi:hypothetical protein